MRVLLLLLAMSCAVNPPGPAEWLGSAPVLDRIRDTAGTYVLVSRYRFSCRVSRTEWETIEVGRYYTCHWSRA